jgi:HAE1 family hydrophobic/amphiphilic exporter-1
MNLPEFGVRRPVTNLMIFSGIIIVSLYSLMNLGIDMMPEIEPPAITVIAVYSGANPEDVETKVAEPLENQLATTPGLDKLTSRCLEGLALITLKFNWGTDLNEASNDIRDRIELAKRFLPDIPDEMDNPFIFKFNTAMIPILFIGFSADQSYPGLYDLIDKQVVDELKQVPGVGTVQLQGGLQRQINVWIDRKRLEGYGFSILDIKDVLDKENYTQPAGNVKYGLTDYLVRVPGEFVTPEEINTVVLGKRKDKLIYMKDVARVEDSHKEVTSIVRINRNLGLMMIIQKQTGTNSVQVAERIKKKLAALMKNLPPDVAYAIIMDTSRDIINSLNSLKSTVWTGGVLVIAVVWFFLRRFLPSLIIALTIPFSLLIAFIYLFLSGKTINVISLSSLTIAIGMVVDNAIVVVDNVYRHMERGRRPREAAIIGTSEMYLAVAASTATTVVVFLPMLFITGVVGIMFVELAISVTVTLTASLFTAVTFSPMLCSQLLKIGRREKEDVKWNNSYVSRLTSLVSHQSWFSRFYDISERWFTSWESAYAKALAWCLGHKKSTLIGFSVAFVCSLLLTPFVGNEFITEQDTGDIRGTIELPLGTRIEESDKTAQRVEEIFSKNAPEIQSMFVRSGQSSSMGAIFGQKSGSHIINVGVKCAPKQDRKRSVQEITHAVRQKLDAVPGIIKADFIMGNPIGRVITGTGGKAIQLEIIGHSFEETGALADKIKAIMEQVPGVVDISISRDLNRPELQVQVNREKASALGLNMHTIAETIKTCIEGATATKYRELGDTYDIYVQLEESSRSTKEDVENLPIVSLFTKKQIKLSNFATICETVGPMEIERKNRERVLRVECNTYKRSSGKVIEDINERLKTVTIPAGITVNFGGEAEEQGKAFTNLMLLLILGIMLVYMVMAAQFESLIDPFVIMFAIPFTFTGVILSFILTGTTLSVISFLAIVMLMGIVVNNAIVLISYIIILRARGMSMLDAVTAGGRDRLRPVLMTTITTLVGLLPLAISKGEGSETWQPLGITMIGGLTVSTLITMLFVPTLYAVFESKLKKR